MTLCTCCNDSYRSLKKNFQLTMALMLAPLPLTDEISVKQQLLTMGFESNHIDEAIKSFKVTFFLFLSYVYVTHVNRKNVY